MKPAGNIIGRTFMRITRSTRLWFAVDTIECLGGSVPKTQQRLVEAWAEIHRAELQQDWELLQSGQPPVKIEPLR